MLKKIKQAIIGSRKTCYIMRHGLEDYIYARIKYGKVWYDQTNNYNHFILESFPDSRLEKYKEYIKHCLNRSKLESFQDILIKIIDKDCENFEEQYKRAIYIITHAKAGWLHPADWSALESFVLSQGFFVLGLECHKKYCKSVFLQKNRFFRGFSKFAVLIEQGRTEDALKELKTLEKNKILQKLRSRALYMARLYCNALNHIDQKPVLPFEEDCVTVAYRRYVEGKKLLIIGPAPTNFSDNNYDSVIRVNDAKNIHQGEGLLGRNTDISYFNVERVDEEMRLGETFLKLKFAVWKNRFNRIGKEYINARGTICPSDILTIGHFNMIQVTLFDLLRFDWKKIKITGVNLMASKKIYTDDYIRGKEIVETENFLDAYSTHNAFCQFYFLKNLYKAGVFSTDNELHEILTHTAKAYSEKMEKLYLSIFRKTNRD